MKEQRWRRFGISYHREMRKVLVVGFCSRPPGTLEVFEYEGRAPHTSCWSGRTPPRKLKCVPHCHNHKTHKVQWLRSRLWAISYINIITENVGQRLLALVLLICCVPVLFIRLCLYSTLCFLLHVFNLSYFYRMKTKCCRTEIQSQ